MSKSTEVRAAAVAALVKMTRDNRVSLVKGYAAASAEADRLTKAGLSKSDAWSNLSAAASAAIGTEAAEVSATTLRQYGPPAAFLVAAVTGAEVGPLPSPKVCQLLYPCRGGAGAAKLAEVAKAHGLTIDAEPTIADRARLALAVWRRGLADGLAEQEAATAAAALLAVDAEAAARAKAEAEAAAAGAKAEAVKAAGDAAAAAVKAAEPTEATAKAAATTKRQASQVTAAIGAPAAAKVGPTEYLAALAHLAGMGETIGAAMTADQHKAAKAALVSIGAALTRGADKAAAAKAEAAKGATGAKRGARKARQATEAAEVAKVAAEAVATA